MDTHDKQVFARAHLDSNGKDLTIEHVQDVEPILERNAQLRAEAQRSDWGRHIGTIPNVILVKWLNEENVNVFGLSSQEFGAFIKRKLADPDNRHLRTDCQANQMRVGYGS